jgi:DNA polymerase III delta prime subunit
MRAISKDKISKRAQSLQDKFSSLIVGQEPATRALTNALEKYLGGLYDKTRPIASLLFLGPTGTGKTATAEAFAEGLFGDRASLTIIDCAEFQHSHDIAKLIGCFTPETEVLMADGSRKRIDDVQIGDNVISGTGVPRRVNFVHKYQHDGELIQLETSGHKGAPVNVTAGHEILAICRGLDGKRATTRAGRSKSIYSRSELKYVPASVLRKGDIVAFPRYKEKIDPPTIDLAQYAGPRMKIDAEYIYSVTHRVKRFVPVDDNFCRLVGYFVSDGGSAKKSIDFHMSRSRKKEALAELPVLMKKVFGINLRSTEERESSDRQYYSSSVVARLMSGLFRDACGEKVLPKWFLKLDTGLLWSFLDAALMGDGGRTVSRRIDYSTTSKTLSDQFEVLLAKIGIVAQLHVNVTALPNKTRYRWYISGHQITEVCSKLPITGKSIDLTKSVPTGIQRNGHCDEDYIYRTVTRVGTVSYTGPVYDLAVDVDESYVLWNQVHNSPPGYLGHKETPPLLKQSTIDQYKTEELAISIVLFDEIEKASDALWHLLLGVLDKGRMTLGDNTKTDFTSTIIIMTSNVGAFEQSGEVFGFAGTEDAEKDYKEMHEVVMSAARRKFTPEFLNRMDEIVMFRRLTVDQIKEIAGLEIAKIQSKLFACNGTALMLTPAALDEILASGYDKKYNVRHLRRTIEKAVVVPAASAIASGQLRRNDDLVVDYKDGEYQLYAVKP